MSNGEGGMSTTASEYVEESLLRGPGAKVISSFCAADKPQCVEVEATNRGVGNDWIVVTDSKDTSDERRELVFTPAEWDAFVAGVKAGEFDLLSLLTASGRVTAGEVVTA